MKTLSINHFKISIIFFSNLKVGLWMFIPNEFTTFLKREKRIRKEVFAPQLNTIALQVR